MTQFVKVFLKVRVEITTIFFIRSFGNKKLSFAFPQRDETNFEEEFKFDLYQNSFDEVNSF